jgi:uncharacterized protein (TIGR00297 family)
MVRVAVMPDAHRLPAFRIHEVQTVAGPTETLQSAPPVLAALGLTLLIVFAAGRARALAPSGAVAALAVGTAAMSRSLGWGAFLVIWFVLAALLSRIGRSRKAERTMGRVEKGDRRDAWQVLANGALFAGGAAALASGMVPMEATDSIAVASVAALVAAGADTWATELGSIAGGRPWSLRERRRVAVGTSGAITAIGSFASAAGAFLLALLAGALTVIPQRAIPLVAAAGLAGAMLDTLIGAWWQERRWCPVCREDTEQRVHRCGTPTERRGGLPAMTNDMVNFACTAGGAALALLLWYLRER